MTIFPAASLDTARPSGQVCDLKSGQPCGRRCDLRSSQPCWMTCSPQTKRKPIILMWSIIQWVTLAGRASYEPLIWVAHKTLCLLGSLIGQRCVDASCLLGMCINVYGYTLGTEGSWVVVFSLCSGSSYTIRGAFICVALWRLRGLVVLRV